MPFPQVPLSTLAERLARKQSELDELRRTYESRLTDLRRRKEELEASLQKVEAEMQGTPGETVPAIQTSPPISAATPSDKPTLNDLLIGIVRERGRAVTVKELVAELVQRNVPTRSSNFPKMIGNRVSDLVHQKVFRRPKKGKGVLLAGTTTTSASAPPKKKAAANGRSASNGAPAKSQKMTLPALVTTLLAKTTEPIKAADLAEQVIAAGYKTKSKKPVDLVWATLGKMENVENVRGQGYRLKR